MNGTTASQHRACLYVQLHITLIRFTHRYILHTATHIYQETGHKTGHKNRFLISDMNEATRVRLRSECVCVCVRNKIYVYWYNVRDLRSNIFICIYRCGEFIIIKEQFSSILGRHNHASNHIHIHIRLELNIYSHTSTRIQILPMNKMCRKQSRRKVSAQMMATTMSMAIKRRAILPPSVAAPAPKSIVK